MSDTKLTHDSETPAHGQQAITATAFIHHKFGDECQVFMPRRAETKKFLPGKLELPGGHLDYGEDIVQGLKREIQEEFGKDIAVGDAFAAFTYVNEVKGSHSVEVVFFAQFVDGIEGIELHAEDHSEYRWMAEDELGELPDDDETKAARRGFALLRGETPKF